MFDKKQYLIDLVQKYGEWDVSYPSGMRHIWLLSRDITDLDGNIYGYMAKNKGKIRLKEIGYMSEWSHNGKIILDPNRVVMSEIRFPIEERAMKIDYECNIFIPQRNLYNPVMTLLFKAHGNPPRPVHSIDFKETGKTATMPFGDSKLDWKITMLNGNDVCHVRQGPSERWAQVDVIGEELDTLTILSLICAHNLPIKGICEDCKRAYPKYRGDMVFAEHAVMWSEPLMFKCGICGKYICDECTVKKDGLLAKRRFCRTCAAMPR